MKYFTRAASTSRSWCPTSSPSRSASTCRKRYICGTGDAFTQGPSKIRLRALVIIRLAEYQKDAFVGTYAPFFNCKDMTFPPSAGVRSTRGSPEEGVEAGGQEVVLHPLRGVGAALLVISFHFSSCCNLYCSTLTLKIFVCVINACGSVSKHLKCRRQTTHIELITLQSFPSHHAERF